MATFNKFTLILIFCFSSCKAQSSLEEKFAQLEAELKNSIIPPGFIYVQLPGEKSPTELWPKFAPWVDISPTFPGVFFRVDGGGAEPFGKVQEEFIPHISQVKYVDGFKAGMTLSRVTMNFQTDKETDPLFTSLEGTAIQKPNAISFKWTTGEVRPKNMAIKVWRRLM